MSTSTRKTADERRITVLAAARSQFADHGYNGASTEAIAHDAGISQPYLFRLFGTKKDLFIAAARDCMGQTLAAFQTAAEGLTGPAALEAIGRGYVELLADRQMLKLQMQMYAAACNDPTSSRPRARATAPCSSTSSASPVPVPTWSPPSSPTGCSSTSLPPSSWNRRTTPGRHA